MDYQDQTAGQQESEVIRQEIGGDFLCWGCGEFGQHGHKTTVDVTLPDGVMQHFSALGDKPIQLAACGASHTIVVTGESIASSPSGSKVN